MTVTWAFSSVILLFICFAVWSWILSAILAKELNMESAKHRGELKGSSTWKSIGLQLKGASPLFLPCKYQTQVCRHGCQCSLPTKTIVLNLHNAATLYSTVPHVGISNHKITSLLLHNPILLLLSIWYVAPIIGLFNPQSSHWQPTGWELVC